MRKYIKIYEEFLKGGLGDNRKDSEFDSKELELGIEDEHKEHGGKKKVAKEITKDPKYYSKMEDSEEINEIAMQIAPIQKKKPKTGVAQNDATGQWEIFINHKMVGVAESRKEARQQLQILKTQKRR
jgi:hypothetical protein